MPFDIDDEYLVDVLKRLVAIDSTNPGITADGAGEGEIARAVASMMEDLGLEVEVVDSDPGRPSVLGTLRGTGDEGGRSLMLNGHLDTVGVEGMEEPFTPRIQNGRMYGRGTQDMKGSLAAHLAAVKALQNAGRSLAGDVIVAAVADEEHLSVGTEAVLTRRVPDMAIVTEPTDLALCLAHKGFAWFDVMTRGRAAHGSRPEEGVDANLRMGRVLAEIDRLENELRQREGHSLAGGPSLHVGTLRGGTAPSVYAASCRARVERRTVPGESVAEVRKELEAVLERVAERSEVGGTLEQAFAREPFDNTDSAALAGVLDEAARRVTGRRPERKGQTYWTDAALLDTAGADTAVMGPVGSGLHTTEEWVDIDSCVTLAEILAETAADVCDG